jgi:hypothetical protein
VKIYRLTVFSRTGKIVEPYPRVYCHHQGIAAVKGYWLHADRLKGYEAFHAPYTVTVDVTEVPDGAWIRKFD